MHYSSKVSIGVKHEKDTYFLPRGWSPRLSFPYFRAAKTSSGGAIRYMYGPRNIIGTC